MLLSLARPVSAQRIVDRFPHRPVNRQIWVQPVNRATAPDRNGAKLMGGIVGGVIGLVAGARIGSAIERGGDDSCYDYFCGLAGGILGGFLGESLAMGVGMQLGDPDPEKRTRRLLYPALVVVGGFAASGITRSAIPMLFVFPIQFVVAW